jgi:DNA polymerase-3 subunit delta
MSYKEFYQAITGSTLKTLYLFYGEETLLIDRMLNTAKDKCLNAATAEFNYVVLNAESLTFDRLYSAIEMLPMMDSRRIVVVKNPSFIQKDEWSDAQLKLFLKFHEEVACSTTTILWVEQVDKRKRIVKDIQKIGSVIHFDKLDETDLNKWIRQEVKKGHKSIDVGTATYFIERCGYFHQDSEVDLYRLSTLLQTLLHSSNHAVIVKADIERVLKQSVEGNIFKMLDALFEKRHKVAVEQTHALIEHGEAELKILFMIQRQIRQLLKVKQLHSEGFSATVIGEQLSLKPFIVKKNITQIQKTSLSSLRAMLYGVEEADRMMKSSSVTTRTVLEWLIVKLLNT